MVGNPQQAQKQRVLIILRCFRCNVRKVIEASEMKQLEELYAFPKLHGTHSGYTVTISMESEADYNRMIDEIGSWKKLPVAVDYVPIGNQDVKAVESSLDK